MRTVYIDAGAPYEVQIGSGLLNRLGPVLREKLQCGTLALISDETVDGLYGDRAAAGLEKAGFRVLRCSFPGGEGSKTLGTVEKILEFLAERGLTRSDCLVALGGGIPGDVAGFAAACWQRGTDFVQVPTTLLAAVDSSVGGKTGVNLSAGKNLAGAFHQPRFVLCDTDCLQTLPAEVLADGLAEMLKYGVLEDPALFARLADGAAIDEDTIARCVEIKARYVAADEKDKGLRQKLNLGHTFGHAIEKCSGYTVPHGHAVAIGMVMAARASYGLGLSAKPLAGEIAGALEKNDLPAATDIPAGELLSAMVRDKKRAGDKITLVLPEDMGRCVLHTVPVSELPRILDLTKGE